MLDKRIYFSGLLPAADLADKDLHKKMRYTGEDRCKNGNTVQAGKNHPASRIMSSNSPH